jgi:imidazole glycerol-phosphate synthase subunit HisF
MLQNRIIPCLLLNNGGLYKTVKFKNPTYIGDPINAIKIFNDKEADEIMVLDTFASKSGLKPNFSLIKDFASECFMPLSYGGGISTVDDAKKLFEIGVEKISIQSSALNDFKLIEKISKIFGSQSIIFSIDIKKNWLGNYKSYSSSLRKKLKANWEKLICDSVSAGVGEILLNSVDKDGTMSGMDYPLISQASSLVSVPLIASGGVGKLDHIKSAINAGANAVSVGSFFVFYGPHKAVLISYPNPKEIDKVLKKNNL